MAALHKTSSFSLLVLVAQAQVFMGQNQTSARSRSKAFFNMDLNSTMRHSQPGCHLVIELRLKGRLQYPGDEPKHDCRVAQDEHGSCPASADVEPIRTSLHRPSLTSPLGCRSLHLSPCIACASVGGKHTVPHKICTMLFSCGAGGPHARQHN